jgi:hypothetical protein
LKHQAYNIISLFGIHGRLLDGPFALSTGAGIGADYEKLSTPRRADFH